MDEVEKEHKNFALWSVILGIIGILVMVPITNLIIFRAPFYGPPIQIIGLLLGVKGIKSSKRKLSIAGIVLCSIGLVLTIITALIVVYLSGSNL